MGQAKSLDATGLVDAFNKSAHFWLFFFQPESVDLFSNHPLDLAVDALCAGRCSPVRR